MKPGTQRFRLTLILVALVPVVLAGLVALTPLAQDTLLALIVSAAAGAVFTAGLVYFLTRPLVSLTQVCDRVISGQELETDNGPTRQDELGRIDQALREYQARHRAVREAFQQTARELAVGLSRLGDGAAVSPPTAGGPCAEAVAEVSQSLREAAKKINVVRARLAQASKLIHEMPTPLVTTDEAGVIRYLNAAAERLLGLSSASCLKKPFTGLLTAPAQTTDPFGRPVLTPTAAAAWLKEQTPREAVLEFSHRSSPIRAAAVAFRLGSPGAQTVNITLRDLTGEYKSLAADRSLTRQESLRSVWDATARAGSEALEAILAANRLVTADAKQSPARDAMLPRLALVRQHAGSLEAYVRTLRWLTRSFWGELPRPLLSEFQAVEPARAAVEQLSLRFKERNVTVMINDRGGWLCGDDEWIRSALLGVLTHAAESVRNATVGLHISRLNPTDQNTDERVLFEVIDAGPPLTDAQRRDLEHPFGGLEAPHYLTPTATGFIPGLVLADELCRQMGGTLEFGSTPGGGLTVKLVVPTRLPGSVVVEPAPEVIDAGPIEELVMGWRLGVA